METLIRKWQGVDREANKSAWKPRNGRRGDSFTGFFQYCKKSLSLSQFICGRWRFLSGEDIEDLWALRVTSKPLSTKLFFSFLHSGVVSPSYHTTAFFINRSCVVKTNPPKIEDSFVLHTWIPDLHRRHYYSWRCMESNQVKVGK